MRLQIGYFIILLLAIALFGGCAPQPMPEIRQGTPKGSPSPTLTLPTIPSSPAPTVTNTPDTRADCLKEGGQVERIAFQSALMGGSYNVSIYRPPCYDEKAGKGYPVLYLLHGQNMDDTFWLGLGVKELADSRIAQGVTPFLMVMPHEVDAFIPATETKFGDSVLTELLPWVEGHYNACTERACRVVGGVSRGGGWAIRLAMRNFDTFGAVGGHSIGLLPGDTWQAQKHLETRTPAEYPRIFLDRGEDDFLKEGIDSFEDVLTRNGIPHEFHVWPGRHDRDYWQAHVAEYLDWYILGWGAESAVDQP